MTLTSSHVNAFLKATTAVFETMLHMPVTFDKPEAVRQQTRHDVSGVIGLSGSVAGSVVLAFDRATAMALVEAFAGPGMEYGSADFADAIGELTNMVVGGAKSKFEGMPVSIGCPTVVTAPDHSVISPSQAARISIPCNTPAGKFVIEVAFMPQGAEHHGASHVVTTKSVA